MDKEIEILINSYELYLEKITKNKDSLDTKEFKAYEIMSNRIIHDLKLLLNK